MKNSITHKLWTITALIASCFAIASALSIALPTKVEKGDTLTSTNWNTMVDALGIVQSNINILFESLDTTNKNITTLTDKMNELTSTVNDLSKQVSNLANKPAQIISNTIIQETFIPPDFIECEVRLKHNDMSLGFVEIPLTPGEAGTNYTYVIAYTYEYHGTVQVFVEYDRNTKRRIASSISPNSPISITFSSCPDPLPSR